MRVHLIINARSGLAQHESVAERVAARFKARGWEIRADVVTSSDALLHAAKRAGEGDADIVVAGGGDGTIAAVASHLVDRGKALGVLPLGTFNFFARRFTIPTDLDEALSVIEKGHTRGVSVGDVNGHTFLNNSSIGLYPAVLRHRERLYSRFGRSRVAAYVSAGFALARRLPMLSLQLDSDSSGVVRRTSLLFVAANPSQLDEFGLDAHTCLAEGRLALFVASPMPRSAMWAAAIRGWLRGFQETKAFETVCAAEVHVTLGRSRVRVAVDGEIIRVRTPVRYRLRHDALQVIAPE